MLQSVKIMKRKSISLEEKLKILQDVDAGILTKKAVSKKYGISFSTLSTIIKNKNKIDSSVALGCSSSVKRLRFASHKRLERLLVEWFNEISSQVPISGPLLRAKAKEISAELNIDNFVCSEGWLWRFKKRHNISSQGVSGEVNSVYGINDWLKLFNTKKSMYAENDIFNLDRTGVFYNLLPERSIDYKELNCKDGSKSRERLTVLVCCSADGSEKMGLWIIGKFQNPTSFNLINRSHLPWVYTFNKRAWLDKAIFQEWIIKFQQKMALEKREILLTLDYDFVHMCEDLNLPNIEIVFFPQTAPSRIQPLARGIIHCLKKDYRKQLVAANLINYESDQPPVKWNILQAARALSAAWDSVTPLAIENCFLKSWSIEDRPEREPKNRLVQEPEEWILYKSTMKTSKLSFSDFVDIDNAVSTEVPFEGDILLTSEDEGEEETLTKPTRKEVMQALSVIQRLGDSADVNPDFTAAFYKVSSVCDQLTRPLDDSQQK